MKPNVLHLQLPVEPAAERQTGEGADYRAALGLAVGLAPEGSRERRALERLLRESMELDAATVGGGALLDVYDVGEDLADLDRLLQGTASRRDHVKAVDAWLAKLGDADRPARLGRYLAALEAAHGAHKTHAATLAKLARSEHDRRELLRTRLEHHLRRHGIPSVRAGDYVFQVITPRRAAVTLLVPVDQLPADFRGTEVRWVPKEDELLQAYETAQAARERRMGQVRDFMELEGATQDEAESMFPPSAAEAVLSLVRVEEKTGHHLRARRVRAGKAATDAG